MDDLAIIVKKEPIGPRDVMRKAFRLSAPPIRTNPRRPMLLYPVANRIVGTHEQGDRPPIHG